MSVTRDKFGMIVSETVRISKLSNDSLEKVAERMVNDFTEGQELSEREKGELVFQVVYASMNAER